MNDVVYNEQSTWFEARAICQSHNMELAELHNSTEKRKTININENSYWIGLTDHKWSWTTGKICIKYSMVCCCRPLKGSEIRFLSLARDNQQLPHIHGVGPQIQDS